MIDVDTRVDEINDPDYCPNSEMCLLLMCLTNSI